MRSIFTEAPEKSRALYEDYLKAMSSISTLFSESSVPYIDYRIIENLFCRCFDAENLSRSCIAIDARLGSAGIGIKTFVNTPYQKIAEFDKKRDYADTGDVREDAVRVSELRNERLIFSKDAYAIDDFLYHYVIRHEGSLSIHECPMDSVNIEKIRVTKETPKSFDFTDGKNKFRYVRAKSTIYECFDTEHPLHSFGVEFMENPADAILKIYSGEMLLDSVPEEPTLILPLFSTKGKIHVPEKSGLNQWNAGGRARSYDEVYIPYPKEYRDMSAGFFPARDTPFDLELPNGEMINAKVCQDSGKAIMSNPNRDLGNWLLRDVLKLEPGEIVTMDMLDDLGINAVMFTKHADGKYSVDFTNLDY